MKPLRAGRLLDTPRPAARFVSLVGYEKNVTLGGVDRAEQWSSVHAFLCRNKGVRHHRHHVVIIVVVVVVIGVVIGIVVVVVS